VKGMVRTMKTLLTLKRVVTWGAACLVFASGAALAQPDHDHGGHGPGPGGHGPPGHAEHGPGPGPGGHAYFDNRFNHGRYYPPRGYAVHELPGGYRTFYHGGRPYFFVGGVWYLNGPDGFIVGAPPPGLVVSVLPPFYTTVWLGGVPYYYADDVYYRWDPGADAYEVVDPAGAPAAPDAPPPPGPPPGPPVQNDANQLFTYPKNGQTQDQQAQDRYECHSWAAGQTGFDPTQPGGGVPPDQNAPRRDQYRRAMTACLEARGYTVE